MFKTAEEFQGALKKKIRKVTGEKIERASRHEQYLGLVEVLMDELSELWVESNDRHYREDAKLVYYFSMEFLIGKLLDQVLYAVGIRDLVESGLQGFSISLNDMLDEEKEAGLGNGGLGRLAACYLDSMAALGISGHGMGLRYTHGMFEQQIVKGNQVEVPDDWLSDAFSWEVEKPTRSVVVRFGGHVRWEEVEGRWVYFHEGYDAIRAVPYDVPIVGMENGQVNTLRLWRAVAMRDMDIDAFHRGEFIEAVRHQSEAEAISQILYPNDQSQEGRILRLKQQYFLVAAGLETIIGRFVGRGGALSRLSESVAIQINDTHPALCIAELMRILIDEKGMDWESAWEETKNTMHYTNHTIMPEALEEWSYETMKNLLPRITMILDEIHRRDRIENPELDSMMEWGKIKMATLSIIGSRRVNGVAKLHTEILKEELFAARYQKNPDQFDSITNGVSHRRFLIGANPNLSRLISEKIGEDWKKKPELLQCLTDYSEENGFLDQLHRVKQGNKEELAAIIQRQLNILVDPNSIFDVQVKRIHAYKRQLLNVLHIMHLYNRIVDDHAQEMVPRTFIFAGKAAPGYYYAKRLIELIHAVSEKIEANPKSRDLIRVVFMQNFNVTLAERLYPAAELSEQISTASREASGTGNMKFMMNGAVTIGTLDGANVEIYREAGWDNMFIFGMKADEVLRYYRDESYHALEEYQKDPRLKRVVDQLINGFFERRAGVFQPIFDSLLLENDQFFVLRDFAEYMETQQVVSRYYRDQYRWNRMQLANIAHSGFFSSDRSIQEYAARIWRLGGKS